MTSILSKGVTKNTPSSNGLQTNTDHHSPGVMLSSKKVVPRSRVTKLRIIIDKNTSSTMIKIIPLPRGYIQRLVVENIHNKSSDTLYTIGTDKDTFTPLCEPHTLSELKDLCVNRYIPAVCSLVCKVTTKNDEKNTDIGSIILTVTLSYATIVSK